VGLRETIEADVVLVVDWPRAYNRRAWPQEVGVKFDERGRVAVDHYYATNVPGIWGDRRRDRRSDVGPTKLKG